MGLKRLYVAMAAKEDDFGRITARGQHRIMSVTHEIHHDIGIEDIFIISSTAPVALDSTSQMMHTLREYTNRVDYAREPFLWCDRDNPGLIRMIREYEDEAPNLLVMTHPLIGRVLPSYIWENELGQKGCIRKLDYFDAICFDMQNKSYRFLP